MNSSLLPLALAVLGGVLYHVAQKLIPPGVSPFAVIIAAYFIGSALCLSALVFEPAERSLVNSIKQMNWTVVVLGVGAAIIEIGFLLAYRAGWNISLASVITNISVALILLPIGLLAFKENISPRNAAGIAFCLLGLYLISKK